MRLHVVGLPHTQVTRAYDWCAYTAKIRRLATMLKLIDGHEMILYSYGESEARCEHVSLGDAETWDSSVVFNDWQVTSPRWATMNVLARSAIEAHRQPGDAVGIIAGRCQAPIADWFAPQGVPILEWGVGYKGVLPDSHRVYESHAWRHYIYGTEHRELGRFFDEVIPNAFDTADLEFSGEHDGYLLYLGRMTPNKGLEIVAELAREHDVRTAGPDAARVAGVEHLGVVLGTEKAHLLARARAVLVPTLYVEPFGGVAVEAMLSGAPVITTDFGAFPETVRAGVSGFRCSTLEEFRAAAIVVNRLNRYEVRDWASQFRVDAVAPRYQRWLDRCSTLYGAGWYARSTLN